MSWLQAFFLGLIQGLTEFFPISSSAHLKIAKQWLHIPKESHAYLFDLFCHLGTLMALIVYFRNDIIQILRYQRKVLWYFIVALIPLIPFYFLLKPLRDKFSQIEYLGYCLIGTALFLLVTSYFSSKTQKDLSLRDALWIGTFQSIALIPGLSRSALTIGTGLWRGIQITEVVRFSFLLSIPTILGGLFLEIFKNGLCFHTDSSTNWMHCFLGLIAAACGGYFMIHLAIPLLEKKIFMPFIGYCLLAGILLSLIL